MLRPIPLVLVGAGRVAHAVYLPLLQGMTETFDLIAIVEPDVVKAAATTARYPVVPIVPDVAYAARLGAHAAICATPWCTHLSVVEECLAVGLHVLCEKPVSLDPDEIARLQAAEAEAGRPVAVGYMKRHSSAVAEFIERAQAVMGEARELNVRLLDPNSPQQVAHLVPPDVLLRGELPEDALVTMERLMGPLPLTPRHEAMMHGLGGSLVHHVNIVHAALGQEGMSLAGHLAYSVQWSDGAAVACGWTPRSDLMVHLKHVRVPEHRRYSEVIQLVSERSLLTLSLPSPYARDIGGELVATEWDRTGHERTTVLGTSATESAFANQIAAWGSMIRGTGPALPGLAEAHLDATVIYAAALSLT